jgi:hypothetical protein
LVIFRTLACAGQDVAATTLNKLPKMDDESIGGRLWHKFVRGWNGYGGGWAYSHAEKLWLLGVGLGQRLHSRRNLFAGPFAGEFGYELMQWQAYVRARRPHYEAVHVLTYPGRDYMYESCHVNHHNIRLDQAGYGYGRMNLWQACKVAHAKSAEI